MNSLFECLICAEEFPTVFSCKKCILSYCIDCLKYGNLNDNMLDPHCINCKNSLSRHDFIEYVGDTWFNNNIKPYREQILLDREKAKIPQTLQQIKEEDEYNNIVTKRTTLQQKIETFMKEKRYVRDYLSFNDQIKDIHRYLKHMKTEETRLGNNEYTKQNDRKRHDDQVDYITRQRITSNLKLERLTKSIAEYETTHPSIFDDIIVYNNLLSENEVLRHRMDEFLYSRHRKNKEKVVFKYRCTTKDCSGLMDENYHCILCKEHMCGDCFEKIEFETKDKDKSEIEIEMAKKKHKCNSETKESVAMIKRETKPCPKCGTSCQKMYGCDQVFCISCGTGFSWTTLTVETGRLHTIDASDYFKRNPEAQQRYLERMKGATENAENRADQVRNNNACNEIVPHVLKIKRELQNHQHAQVVFIIELRRSIEHYNAVFVPNLNRKWNDTELNADYRKMFVRKATNEKEFKSILHRRYKKIEFEKELHAIIMNANLIWGNILWNIDVDFNLKDLDNLIEEVNLIKQTSNELITQLENDFGYLEKRKFVFDVHEDPSTKTDGKAFKNIPVRYLCNIDYPKFA